MNVKAIVFPSLLVRKFQHLTTNFTRKSINCAPAYWHRKKKSPGRGEVLKHGKKPTRAQKIRIKSLGLNPENWLVVKDCRDTFEIVHRVSGKIRTLKKAASE